MLFRRARGGKPTAAQAASMPHIAKPIPFPSRGLSVLLFFVRRSN
jgi:hypothetical protein